MNFKRKVESNIVSYTAPKRRVKIDTASSIITFEDLASGHQVSLQMNELMNILKREEKKKTEVKKDVKSKTTDRTEE